MRSTYEKYVETVGATAMKILELDSKRLDGIELLKNSPSPIMKKMMYIDVFTGKVRLKRKKHW